MKKLLIPNAASEPQDLSAQPLTGWIDVASLATAELTSEDPRHPLEDALNSSGEGWIALKPGPQTIRLRFEPPIHVQHLRLEFKETDIERSQEFAVFAEIQGQPKREILRQQWNFHPIQSPVEIEQYDLDLPGLTALELQIDPGRHDKTRIAKLARLNLR